MMMDSWYNVEQPWRTTLEKNFKSFETVVMERMTDVVKKHNSEAPLMARKPRWQFRGAGT